MKTRNYRIYLTFLVIGLHQGNDKEYFPAAALEAHSDQVNNATSSLRSLSKDALGILDTAQPSTES